MKQRIGSIFRRCVAAIEDNWRTAASDARKALLAAVLAIPISVVVVICLGVAIIAVIMALSVVIVVLGLVSVVLLVVLAIVPPTVLIGLLFAPFYFIIRMLQRRLTR